ncbi:MAG: hypothetical protein CM1200mP10_28410 [Candidatus Neomarinimicrobiota bacterium]|nr:MAG: hypothetical protein CM1200mP10_28410 [Candidatus Neomarinimicrobiota bacterium]
METGKTVGENANPKFLKVCKWHVTGAPDDLKWVGVTANAGGALASPVDALAYLGLPQLFNCRWRLHRAANHNRSNLVLQ